MAKEIIHGGHPVEGTVTVDAAKNAVLPILAATLLTEEGVRLKDIPVIVDVDVLLRLLSLLGVTILREGADFLMDASSLTASSAPYYLTSRMRASFLLAGPLLARLGRAEVALPGGCAIGSRPVDLHLKGFEAMGARVELIGGTIRLAAEGLQGASIYLDYPSVGATENLMMAASLAEGTTVLKNAALEPEISDLSAFLTAMGADIQGAGTGTIVIRGTPVLHGCAYTTIPDRIEAGTYLVAAAATGGDVTVRGVHPEHLRAVLAKLQEIGAKVKEGENSIRLVGPKRATAVDLKTLPYPGFPTDMQAPFMALLARAKGTSVVTETVFENRFRHVEELHRMGARIRVEGRSAIIEGVPELDGAPVRAKDLRGAAALTVAGLTASGETEVQEAELLDRGYRNLEAKLALLGADIERAD